MSSIPTNAEKKLDFSKKLYPSKPPYSTERKTTRTIENTKKSTYGNAQPLAKSHTNLHFKGRKPSSFKTTVLKASKASSTAAMFKEPMNEPSPREKAFRRLSEIQRCLYQKLYSQNDKRLSTVRGMAKATSPDALKTSKTIANDTNQGDNIVNRLSYKSMSSMSSDKKSAAIFEQATVHPQKNLFGNHFRKMRKTFEHLFESDKNCHGLKSSSSFSKNLNDISQQWPYKGSSPKLFDSNVGKQELAAKKSKNTSMPILEVKSLVQLEPLKEETVNGSVANLSKSNLCKSHFEEMTKLSKVRIEHHYLEDNRPLDNTTFKVSMRAFRDELEPVKEEANAELRCSVKEPTEIESKLTKKTVSPSPQLSGDKRKPTEISLLTANLSLQGIQLNSAKNISSSVQSKTITDVKELKIKSKELVRITNAYSQYKLKPQDHSNKSPAPKMMNLDLLSADEGLYVQKNAESLLQGNTKQVSDVDDHDLMSFGEYPTTTDRMDRVGAKHLAHDNSYINQTIDLTQQNIYDPKFTVENEKGRNSKLKSKDRLFRQRSSTSSNEIRKTSLSFSKESVIEGYKLIREIGRGTYAVVFKCSDCRSGQGYAIKMYERKSLLNPTRLRNVQEEIQNLKRLNHQSIVKYVADFETNTRKCIVMEYAGKTSLSDFLKKRTAGCLSEIEARDIFRKLAAAVKHCHDNGVAHRDLKLENVTIFGLKDKVKLIDFGFSTTVEDRALIDVDPFESEFLRHAELHCT